MIDASPRVTIVTPSYNQAPFLEEAIESVLSQDYANLEYAVVDGGSTDGSVDIIRRYEDRLAWWVSEPDGGQADALNKAFARATGDLLGWINSDDALLPGAVSTVVKEFVADPQLLLVYGDAVFVDDDSDRVGYFRSVDLDPVDMMRTATDHIVQQGALFTREAFDVAGPMRGYFCFDFEFMVRVGLAGRAKRIGRPLALYRFHDESKTMSRPELMGQDWVRFFEEFYAGADVPPHVRAVEDEGKAAAYLWASQCYYSAGQHARAREAAKDALRHDPRHASRRALPLLAKTLLPPRATQRLREIRHRVKPVKATLA
jgi:glycosyltransferase involved in cell wall biosynthesis